MSHPDQDAAEDQRASDDATDEALLAAHIAGDGRAFRYLFNRYGARIHAVMLQRGLSEADAQDIVQQTFLRAHQARRDFKRGMTVRPWLWTIAFNLMRDVFRRGAAARRGTASIAETVRAGQETESSEPESVQAMRRALLALPESHREVVLLHWFQGLSFAEVAEVVSASESAVKVRAHRAYKRLRELLGSGEEAAP